MTGPLCGQDDRMSGLSRAPVVLRPGFEGQNLASKRRLASLPPAPHNSAFETWNGPAPGPVTDIISLGSRGAGRRSGSRLRR
jgi:hypothetical protein